ncbi:hypothetical protein B0H13DRAFT_2671355, partial [Mycena leptocephala]
MSIGWSEGNGMSTPSKVTRAYHYVPVSHSLLCPCAIVMTFTEGHSIDQASGALCLPLARAARPLSFFGCCTRCLDARLVFFSEYKVPPNKPGGKDSRCHEAYARGYVYLQNWMRAWMAAREEGVDGLHLYSCIIYELNIFYFLSF